MKWKSIVSFLSDTLFHLGKYVKNRSVLSDFSVSPNIREKHAFRGVTRRKFLVKLQESFSNQNKVPGFHFGTAIKIFEIGER